MIRTLVTGYGYWGSVLTLNLLEHPDFFVAGVHDPDEYRRRAAREANLYTFRTLQDALDFITPQLVIIASPIGTQVEVAMMAMSRYANVMIAKPGATNLADLRRIDSLAKRKDRVAAIDYTMRHAYGFHKLQSRVQRSGRIVEVHTERNAVGNRTDAPILYDILVHDIALLHALREEPWRVSNVDRGDNHLSVRLDTCDVTATLTARTDAHEQSRKIRIVASDAEYEWDQLEATIGATPVRRSLTDLARRITKNDHDMTLEYRVTATLEEVDSA